MSLRRFSVLLLLLLLFPGVILCRTSSAQTTLELVDEDSSQVHSGLVPLSPEEYAKLEQVKAARSFSADDAKPYQNLPRKVDLAAQLPSPGDQGKQNSCTAWAVAFAVKSFQEKRELGWDFSDKHLFSPAFVYNQINGGQDRGALLKDAINVVLSEGVVPLSFMPYQDGNYTAQPTEALKKAASYFKGLSYRRLDEKDVPQIKSFLASGEPVILSVMTYKNFLPKGMVRSGNVYKEKVGGFLGGHAIVAVGYDDDRNAVKILNSWGKGWGENGYGWIDYAFFPQVVMQAFVMYDLPTPREAVAALDNSAIPTPPPLPKPTLPATPSVPTVLSRVKSPVLIVANEGGLKIGDRWLRLGSSWEQAAQALGYRPNEIDRLHAFNAMMDEVMISPDFLTKDRIGMLHFFDRAGTPVATNEGVTFGSNRADVRRIYQAPDHVDDRFKSDAYFFHAVAQEWGGVPVTQHIALFFYYDDRDRVTRMSLGAVVKQSVQGTGFTPMAGGEQTATAEGSRVQSAEGGIDFTAPAKLPEVKKSVWEGAGFGYFIRDPNKPGDFIAVKVFTMKAPVTGQDIETRIKADLSAPNTPAATMETSNFGGLQWRVAKLGNMQTRYYAAKGSNIYQVQIYSGQDLAVTDWVQPFLSSISIR
ncbi:MAG TPA: C1 family peptidase [bacterium]|nr:C1 family peptidase [bacterium]